MSPTCCGERVGTGASTQKRLSSTDSDSKASLSASAPASAGDSAARSRGLDRQPRSSHAVLQTTKKTGKNKKHKNCLRKKRETCHILAFCTESTFSPDSRNQHSSNQPMTRPAVEKKKKTNRRKNKYPDFIRRQLTGYLFLLIYPVASLTG